MHHSRTLLLALAVTFITPAGLAYARSGGAFANGVGDRSGSPISSSTCSACHSGGSFNSTVTVSVFDGLNQPVTAYVPGGRYTVQVAISGQGASAYGFQLAGLDASNGQAGTFSMPSLNSQVSVSGSGVEYVEHSRSSLLSTFDVSWSPSNVQGAVTFYAAGLSINSNGGTSGDQVAIGQASLTAPLPDFDQDGVPDDLDADDDNDGVVDDDDTSPKDPDVCQDLDNDTCDDCAVGVDDLGAESDAQPLNDGADTDADGICDLTDVCEGDDKTGDSDADGVCDSIDVCQGDDASGDSDADGICDDIDACQGDDTSGDSDNDGVCDNIDVCEGDDSLGDDDNDGICDVMVDPDMGPDASEEDMTPDASEEDMTLDASVEDATPDSSVEDMTPDSSTVEDSTPDQTFVDMGTTPPDDGGSVGGGSGCSAVSTASDTSLVGFLFLCVLGGLVRRRRRG